MSRAASLPGAELFLKKLSFCLKKPLVPGSFAAWGRTFGRKLIFSKKPLVPCSFAAWGRTFFQKIVVLYKKPLVPGSFAAWGRTFPEHYFFEGATCPGQLRCLGQNVFSKFIVFGTSNLSRAASLPDADLFSRKSTFLGRSHVSQAAKLPGAKLFPEI